MSDAAYGSLRHRWRTFRREHLLPDHSRRGRLYIGLRGLLQLAIDRLHPPPPPPPPPAAVEDPATVEARRVAEARAAAQSRYEQFMRLFEPDAAALAHQRERAIFETGPTFSIVTPVFDPPLETFRQAAASLLAQTWPHWIWHVADVSSDDTVWKYLQELAARDRRVRPLRLETNRGIGANTNAALAAADAEFVAMFDHDDTIAAHALWSIAQAIAANPGGDFFYSDCDKLDEAGVRCEPLFKPDWSPEMALGCNYLDQFAVFRRSLLERVAPIDPDLDGAQDWDFYLRLAAASRGICHVPGVLYHWRKTPQSTAATLENKPQARVAQQKVIVRQLDRLGVPGGDASFEPGHPVHANFPRVTWPPPPLRVSIVVPTRDHAPMLATCLAGVLGRTDYADIEVVLVDTGSVEAETAALYATLAGDSRIRFAEDRGVPFNFSRACNIGVRRTTGDLVLLLNNDVEVEHPDWLTRMTQWFAISSVAVAGATLLFPDRTVQHAGVIIGFGGLASNLFIYEREHADSVYGPEGWYRNLSAVSGACLLTSRRVYDELGGLDETFTLNYSDVDYCVRACAAGYRVVLTPDARLIHHESVTHGHRAPRADFERATVAFADLLRRGDPYYNPNLSMHACRPAVRLHPRDNPRDANDDLMARLPRKAIIEMPGDLQL